MDITQMTRQFFEFQKTTFNNTFNALKLAQDQAEKFSTGLIAQNPALPQQTKDAVDGCLKMCKKAQDDYKKTIDESFKNLEQYFSETNK